MLALLLAAACSSPATTSPAATPAGTAVATAASIPAAAAPVATPAVPAPRDVDVATLKADLDAGRVALLLDVRTPEEYAGGHVAAAKNIPVSEIQARIGELEPFRGRPVYLICRSGGRSAAAAKILAEKGFEAVNVAGGTGAWIEAGLPVAPG